MRDLAGQAALVTGASGAIGGAVARALAEAGVRLYLTGRDRERLAEAAEAVRRASPTVVLRAADLADDAQLAALVRGLEGAFGGCDLLIHAAGGFVAGEVAEVPVEELDRQLRVNLRAPYLLTQKLLPGLVERGGQVVFINSTVGTAARGTLAVYSASKHGLRALADSLREEVNRRGVRVLSVFPGRTASAMQAEVHRLEGRSYDPDRFMQPSDVAAAVVSALVLPASAELTELTIRPMRP